MKIDSDEWRREEVINQSRSERNNVQLTEIVNIHSTDETVDTAAALEMPARPVNPVSSARSARLRRTPFTSAPAQYQLMPRALLTSNTDPHIVSLLEDCDTCVSTNCEQCNVPMLGYSQRNNFGLPKVRMARTKQTARRDRNERRRDDDRHDEERRSEERRGREPDVSTCLLYTSPSPRD